MKSAIIIGFLIFIAVIAVAGIGEKITTLESHIIYTSNERITKEPYIGEVEATAIETEKDMVLQTAQDFAYSREYILFRYDCDDFSKDLKAVLYGKFREKVKVNEIRREVNCDYMDYWAYCKESNGLHEFLLITINDTKPFYLEATNGEEITEDMYKYYNLENK